MRIITNINQGWTFCKEGNASSIDLPHSWNALDGQDGGDDYYRGVCRYTKKLTYRPEPGNHLFLEFRGVSSEAEINVNGAFLGRHEGGYSTFRVDVTDHWKDENTISVNVSNAPNEHVYPQKADFTFYGGIYRDVYLVEVPASHFALECDGTSGIYIDAQVDGSNAHVTIRTEVVGCSDFIRFRIGDLIAETKAVNGIATAQIDIENVHLWQEKKILTCTMR